MVDATERLKGFDPPAVFSLCQDFLGGEDWTRATLQDFEYKVLNQGFGNRLFVCQVKTQDKTNYKKKKSNDIPVRVLVRFYGGNVLPRKNPIRSLNETTEVLLFSLLGTKGLGPQIFGCFEGGRIEEYIPSRNLSVQEFVSNTLINDSIARCIARYHCLDSVPVKKIPWDISLILRAALDSYSQMKQEIVEKIVPPEFYKTSPNFFDFDLINEITWIEAVLPLIRGRVTFTHNDLNRSNILVRDEIVVADENGNYNHNHEDKIENEIDKSLNERLVLIDYEFSGYNYRGIDLGNHFCMKVFDFGSSNFITRYSYPCQEFRRRFITTYLNEVKKCNEESEKTLYPDWDDLGMDSIDHVLMEAEFGSLVRRLTNVSGILSALDNWLKICHSRSVIDPVFKNGLIFKLLVDFYHERKAAFLESWPQFAKLSCHELP